MRVIISAFLLFMLALGYMDHVKQMTCIEKTGSYCKK